MRVQYITPRLCSIMSRRMNALQFVKTQLPPAPARVLEVGCGNGRLARAVDDLGYRVTAIDPAAPEGAIFQRVALEDFFDPVEFDAVISTGCCTTFPTSVPRYPCCSAFSCPRVG
jgi:2-polyprenyl-3-methyl-5-hydroxy-6-metoxy-1,4-benzoquinol methylase